MLNLRASQSAPVVRVRFLRWWNRRTRSRICARTSLGTEDRRALLLAKTQTEPSGPEKEARRSLERGGGGPV